MGFGRWMVVEDEEGPRVTKYQVYLASIFGTEHA